MMYNFLLSMETGSVREDAMKVIEDTQEAYDRLQNRQKNLSFLEGTKVSFAFFDHGDGKTLGLRLMLVLNGRSTGLEFESRFDPEAMIYPGDVAADLAFFKEWWKEDGYLAALTAYVWYYTTITVVYDESEPVLASVRFELDVVIPNRPRFSTELSTHPQRVSGLMRLGVEEKTVGQS